MNQERREDQSRHRHRRKIRWTVALLGSIAVLIYLGFISRGVFG